ncbi:MAG TPA: helix-turn-helix domain-containing protein, partial [Polyangiales bacterium]|nr:helix-turn-helix domain-containing protein [Polyangiales bacterium]
MTTPLDVAARALAAGDPLAALKLIALHEDAPALALRGVAMAQLGEFARAQALLRSAERAFGSAQPLARARCILAQTEVSLAVRDLRGRPAALRWALRALELHGDAGNALYARLLSIRRAL